VSQYATKTTVSPAKSQSEIMETFERFGIKEHAVFKGENITAIAFARNGLQYRMTVTMPSPTDKVFVEGVRTRTPLQIQAAYESEVRRRWRSLALLIKAKIVAIEDGISGFEQEFLSHVVVGNDRTLGDSVIPALRNAASTGQIPSSLPIPGVSSLPERRSPEL
jgi:hypothetical protein